MANDFFAVDLLVADGPRPSSPLEARVVEFLEGMDSTEPLDGPEFSRVNGSETKADYLLGNRLLIAELKTINDGPELRTEDRLGKRLAHSDAPIVFGTVPVTQVIGGLQDQEAINKMMLDMAGRAVRRHLKKANDQIGAMKERLGLPDAGGMLVLMNDSEPMIDVAAICYAAKSAFDTVEGGYPNITNIWALVESHRIAMPGGRTGFPHVHVFRSLDRKADLDYLGRMLWAWGIYNKSPMERLEHRGNWDAMQPIYDGQPPTLNPFGSELDTAK